MKIKELKLVRINRSNNLLFWCSCIVVTNRYYSKIIAFQPINATKHISVNNNKNNKRSLTEREFCMEKYDQGLDSTDQAQRGWYKKGRGLIFFHTDRACE